MRKTTIIAAAVAMSASVAGLAYAAAPDGRSTEDSSVVTPFSPAGDPSSSSTSSRSSSSTPTASPTDDHGRGGHGADDGVATSTPSMPTGSHQRHDGSDDGPGHDVGDDHGGDRHGGDRHGGDDDSSGRGSGDDDSSGHGSGGHGSDD